MTTTKKSVKQEQLSWLPNTTNIFAETNTTRNILILILYANRKICKTGATLRDVKYNKYICKNKYNKGHSYLNIICQQENLQNRSNSQGVKNNNYIRRNKYNKEHSYLNIANRKICNTGATLRGAKYNNYTRRNKYNKEHSYLNIANRKICKAGATLRGVKYNKYICKNKYNKEHSCLNIICQQENLQNRSNSQGRQIQQVHL